MALSLSVHMSSVLKPAHTVLSSDCTCRGHLLDNLSDQTDNGQHNGLVVSNVASEQENLGLKPWVRVHFSCLRGFSPVTSVSSHSQKHTC